MVVARIAVTAFPWDWMADAVSSPASWVALRPLPAARRSEAMLSSGPVCHVVTSVHVIAMSLVFCGADGRAGGGCVRHDPPHRLVVDVFRGPELGGAGLHVVGEAGERSLERLQLVLDVFARVLRLFVGRAAGHGGLDEAESVRRVRVGGDGVGELAQGVGELVEVPVENVKIWHRTVLGAA